MEDQIDQKIKQILNNLHIAHAKTEQFYAKQFNPNEPIKPMDFFDMALAFDSEDKLLVDLELTSSEKYPHHYTAEQIEFYKKERERLEQRIQAWKNRQVPNQNKL